MTSVATIVVLLAVLGATSTLHFPVSNIKKPSDTRITKLAITDHTALRGNNITCPDRSQCNGTVSTCCVSGKKEGVYGCCPCPDAVCCDNKIMIFPELCCPAGYTCNPPYWCNLTTDPTVGAKRAFELI